MGKDGSKKKLFRYWSYFFIGINKGKPGFVNVFLSWWYLLHLHLLVGTGLAYIVPHNLGQSAKIVLIPLIGILIGLAFAWSGNAHALLQSEEIHTLTNYHKGGFRVYVFSYQTAILVILFTLVVWAIAGLSIFDKVWPTPALPIPYFIIKLFVYSTLSLSVRECWRIFLDTQHMLITQKAMKDIIKQRPEKNDRN